MRYARIPVGLWHVSQSRRIDVFWNACRHRGPQFVKSTLAPRDSTPAPRSGRMLNAGQFDEATRYNMTAIIGLPAEAVDEMAQAPWWPGFVAVAPTLVYDHKASHDIETDPDWRSRWAAVTVPHTEDRLFVPAEFVPLFAAKGWRLEGFL